VPARSTGGQAPQQRDGKSAPATRTASLTSPKDGGAEARAIPAPAEQNPATYVERPPGPPPHARARRFRKPTRRSRSAEHPPGCLACTARQGQLPGGARGHHPRRDRLRDRIPNPTRTAAAEPADARDARIPQRHGSPRG
jgi:hypothetical protein